MKITTHSVVYDRDASGKSAKQSCTDVPPEEGCPYQCPHLFGNYYLEPAK